MINDKLVHFPWLHPKLAPGPLPENVVFLDPGVRVDTESARWQPSDLPCAHGEVRTILHNYMQFAERFPRVSDMQAYHAAGLDNFYTDTTMDITSQLIGPGTPAVSDDMSLKRQAQLMLAMALFREEQFVGMHEQEGRFESARDGFADVLGLDDDESFAEMGVPDDALFPRACVDLPWKGLLPYFLVFLPAGVPLFVSDEDVVRELVSMDLTFTPCGDETDGMISCRLGESDVERVCGRTIPVPVPLTIMARSLNI